MFESTLSAQGLSASNRRLGPLSVAILAHVAIVAVIVGIASLIIPPVESLKLPPIGCVFPRPPELNIDTRPPAAPRPRQGTDAAKPSRSVTPQAPIEERVQPHETPETLPTPSEAPPTEGSELPGDGGTGSPGGTGLGVGDGPGGGEGGRDDGGSGPAVITGDMVKPQLLVKVEPAYPNVARIARLGGRVTVKAVIGLDGSVESAEISSSSSPLFNDAARDAVLKWRYRPALMNGKPVRVYFTVAVEFSVR